MSEKNHTIILIGCILISSILGGYYNAKKYTGTCDDIFHYMFIGLIGASLIPLFLKLIMSDLVENRLVSNYLVFFGFTLLGSIFANQIIDVPKNEDNKPPESSIFEKSKIVQKLAIIVPSFLELIAEMEDDSVKTVIDKYDVIPTIASSKNISKEEWKIQVEDILTKDSEEYDYELDDEFIFRLTK